MKVLVADDDRVTRRTLEAALSSWGYDVVVVADGLSAWRLLQHPDAPSLAVLDSMMPGMHGADICRELRRVRREPYIYVVMLTAKIGRRDRIEGLEAGADDYVPKPFDPPELRVRLRAGERILRLQAELIAAREAIRHQATHDPLTGAWNRAAIIEHLERELARTVREPMSLSVGMIDLDNFKRINDTHGHLVGDAVLVETTRRLRATIRPYDAIGRYGGDEFLVVLPHCGVDDVAATAERLRLGITELPVPTAAGPTWVTASVGIVVCDGGDPTVDGLIHAADSALYRAKGDGRNRLFVCAPTRAGTPHALVTT